MGEVDGAPPVPAGEVRISRRALAQIVRHALADLGGAAEIAEVAGALEVMQAHGALEVDLSLSLQAGAPIEQVAEQARQLVSARLAQATGMPIARLHIYLHDTRQRSRSAPGG